MDRLNSARGFRHVDEAAAVVVAKLSEHSIRAVPYTADIGFTVYGELPDSRRIEIRSPCNRMGRIGNAEKDGFDSGSFTLKTCVSDGDYPLVHAASYDSPVSLDTEMGIALGKLLDTI